jgi:hypothetical protein
MKKLLEFTFFSGAWGMAAGGFGGLFTWGGANLLYLPLLALWNIIGGGASLSDSSSLGLLIFMVGIALGMGAILGLVVGFVFGLIGACIWYIVASPLGFVNLNNLRAKRFYRLANSIYGVLVGLLLYLFYFNFGLRALVNAGVFGMIFLVLIVVAGYKSGQFVADRMIQLQSGEMIGVENV